MANPAAPTHWQRPLIVAGAFILVIAALYWARAVLVPVVTAVLFTFTLSPFVSALQRRGLRRVMAVLLVMVLAVAVLAAVGGVVIYELKVLADDLPNHQDVIGRKVVALREVSQASWLDGFSKTFKAVSEKTREAGPAVPPKPEPIPVTIEAPEYGFVQAAANPILEGLASAGLVFILVIFMLIQREGLRNRLIRLWHFGSLPRMTRALDDAGRRISRFLFMQFLINAVFGLAVAVGLAVIGVPYAVLWGFVAAVMRYIPYVGAWLAAALPIILSIAVFPGWTQPLLVVGLFGILEVLAGTVAEPLLFGQSIGVSEVALLVSAAFWTWLWGPIGLVLATPLTACLVVLGRHVPPLEFLAVLLGDEPALEPHLAYFQRLLARDEDEAADVIEQYLEKQPLAEVFDKVFLPALVLAKETRERDELSEEDEQFIVQITRQVLEEVVQPRRREELAAAHASTEVLPEPILVFGCPAHDALDELALDMVPSLLDPRRCRFEVLSDHLLSAEVVTRVENEKPALICIVSLPPNGLTHARYLCKRLHGQFPATDVLTVRWGSERYDGQRGHDRLTAAGASRVVDSLLELRQQLLPQVQVLSHKEEARKRTEVAAVG